MNRALGLAGVIVGFGGALLGIIVLATGLRTRRESLLRMGRSYAGIVLAGAVLAPRFTYIEPQIAYSPMVSFQVVIMALLGGTHRLWGPLVGVLPFVLLHEWLAGRFPNHTHILLGLTFLLIVYFIPQGISGWIEKAWRRLRGESA